MNCSREAKRLLDRVPSVVRPRVLRAARKEAAAKGSPEVLPEHLEAVKKAFIEKMPVEARGFRLKCCFGPSGCPRSAMDAGTLLDDIENILVKRGLAEFLAEKIDGPLKLHHEFRVTVSQCANACSRPQIVDFGIIGALMPEVGEEECIGCGECADACPEEAVTLPGEAGPPRIDGARCLACGMCVRACPSGALAAGQRGFRLLIGGKLGRRPRLGEELEGIYPGEEVLDILEKCLDIYMENNKRGERLGEVVQRLGLRRVKRLLESP